MTRKQDCFVLYIFCVARFLHGGFQTNAETTSRDERVSDPSNENECSAPTGGRSATRSWYYEGYCYRFYGTHSVSYHRGKIICEQDNAVLVSIHSPGEMRFILQKVPSRHSLFWIGMQREAANLPYKWEDDTVQDYRNFYESDDEDYDSESSGDFSDSNDCVSFYTPSGWWQKKPCDSQAHVVCKYKKPGVILSTTTTLTPGISPGFCPDGWYTFDDRCYRIFGISSYQREGWNRANVKCRDMGSSLVSVHSTEEQDFLKMLLLDIGSNTWIGLRRSSSGGEFYWKDSSPVDFTNWEEGEPNNHEGQEECVHMEHEHGKFGKWNDAVCGSSLPYICQKPKDPTLTTPGVDPSLCTKPEGWLKMKTSCLKVFYKSESYTSWLQAQSLCKSYGANLVYMNSFTVTMFLRGHLRELPGPFWTGIKRTSKHKYAWLGTHPLVYSNWQSGQPKEEADEQNCVAIDREGRWMVRDCEENHPFICEVSEHPGSPTIEPYHRNMTCPETSPEWHDFGGRYCYIIRINAELSWHEASCACNKKGGYLASFHSRSEINVILHYIKHHAMPLHIGLERDEQGRFSWSDGSPTDFINWNTGEPNDRNEQCAEMKTTSGRWNDISCSSLHGYICSTLKVPQSGPSESDENKGDSKGPDAGRIVLIILCTLLLIILVAVSVYFCGPSIKTKLLNKSSYSGIKG